MADPTLYGWTSARTRAAGIGTVIYLHVDGHEVEVDLVTVGPTCTESKWGDEVCVGVVTQWVRTGWPSEWIRA